MIYTAGNTKEARDTGTYLRVESEWNDVYIARWYGKLRYSGVDSESTRRLRARRWWEEGEKKSESPKEGERA